MPLEARLACLLGLWALQFLYFPINRLVQGGVVLDTPWDAYFPLQPIWVIPYLLSLAWWLGCYIWATWKMDDGLFRAFVTSFVVVMLASYVAYILFPTYVVRPVVTGDDWLSRIVAHLYANDHANNAFPSGHTYNTALIALYWSRWHPRHWWLWWLITAIVLLSTLFTRQHNLPDVVGGLVLAWVGYRLGLRWTRRCTLGT
jgi:membrane-associated phospholipid phosphatase